VVENGDALGRFDVVLAAFFGHGRNESKDGCLGGSIVPRGQWVLRGVRKGTEKNCENRNEYREQEPEFGLSPVLIQFHDFSSF
jgi:hypothetical protein